MKVLGVILLSGLLAAISLSQLGCETESASDNDLQITPRATALRINQSQEFTVSGGFDYTWSLATPGLGTLTATRGASTVYISRTAPAAGSAPTVQTLMVSSTPRPDSDTSVSNGTSFVKTGEAIIEHLPIGSTGGSVVITAATAATTTPATTVTTTGTPPPLPIL
ncbi:MAG: hypothetical protein O3A51_09515 [Verrucomicrobia bacterium]|nr:hypothetical protein [Verrucomicrobiota bacterium]